MFARKKISSWESCTSCGNIDDLLVFNWIYVWTLMNLMIIDKHMVLKSNKCVMSWDIGLGKKVYFEEGKNLYRKLEKEKEKVFNPGQDTLNFGNF